MNIGILGGTFNPIHNGHLAVAQYAMEQCDLDEVLFMTAAKAPHKNKPVLDSKIRHEMVCASVENYKDFYPLDYEVRKGGISYTAETLICLNEHFISDSLSFIIGADSLMNFENWYEPEKVAENCKIIVYPRNNVDIEAAADNVRCKFNADITIIQAPAIQVSSSEIRFRIKHGKPVDFFMPDAAMKIIKRENLYA